MTREEAVPSKAQQLGTRISDICDAVGGKKKLADMTGISESQLFRYIKGTSQPTAEPLAAIALAAGVSLDWLVLGINPMQRDAERTRFAGPINKPLLAAILGAIDELSSAFKYQIPVKHLGWIAAEAYNRLIVTMALSNNDLELSLKKLESQFAKHTKNIAAIASMAEGILTVEPISVDNLINKPLHSEKKAFQERLAWIIANQNLEGISTDEVIKELKAKDELTYDLLEKSNEDLAILLKSWPEQK